MSGEAQWLELWSKFRVGAKNELVLGCRVIWVRCLRLKEKYEDNYKSNTVVVVVSMVVVGGGSEDWMEVVEFWSQNKSARGTKGPVDTASGRSEPQAWQ